MAVRRIFGAYAAHMRRIVRCQLSFIAATKDAPIIVDAVIAIRQKAHFCGRF